MSATPPPPPPPCDIPTAFSISSQLFQQAARLQERHNRRSDSPDLRRTPFTFATLSDNIPSPSAPSHGPATFNGQTFNHLPGDLADRLAALPPLSSTPRRRRRPPSVCLFLTVLPFIFDIFNLPCSFLHPLQLLLLPLALLLLVLALALALALALLPFPPLLPLPLPCKGHVMANVLLYIPHILLFNTPFLWLLLPLPLPYHLSQHLQCHHHHCHYPSTTHLRSILSLLLLPSLLG